MRPHGLILFEGASLYDGAPIVAIATLESDNPKTGDMVQTWILRSDVAPFEAVKTGSDSSVCGRCPLRPAALGGCYVRTYQAPSSIWRAYQRGLYPRADAESIACYVSGRDVRLGAYGDPAAVPVEVWNGLLAHARRHTGYSHGTGLESLCMVSTSDLTATRAAWSKGFRTFRAGHGGPVAGEIVCPSPRLTCKQCGICNGAGSMPSVYIDAHGAQARRIM
jgi:hypothetical protein